MMKHFFRLALVGMSSMCSVGLYAREVLCVDSSGNLTEICGDDPQELAEAIMQAFSDSEGITDEGLSWDIRSDEELMDRFDAMLDEGRFDRTYTLLPGFVLPPLVDFALPNDFVSMVFPGYLDEGEPFKSSERPDLFCNLVAWGRPADIEKLARQQQDRQGPVFLVRVSDDIFQTSPNSFTSDELDGDKVNYLSWGRYPVRTVQIPFQGAMADVLLVGAAYKGYCIEFLCIPPSSPSALSEAQKIWASFVNETKPIL